jgi:cell shape-determining protein MreD
MRFALYLILFYLFIPFNRYADVIAIIIFFIFWHENDWIALGYALFVGLLIDLYYPAMLGLNMLLLLILGQALILARDFIILNIPTTIALFSAFFLLKTIVIILVSVSNFHVWPIILTFLFFTPIYLGLHKLVYRQWTKT